jgi:hypothetical protein
MVKITVNGCSLSQPFTGVESRTSLSGDAPLRLNNTILIINKSLILCDKRLCGGGNSTWNPKFELEKFTY